MAKDAFEHVETWIFDLDNTLYPPSSALFDQIHVKMTAFICDMLSVSEEEADTIRADYWKRYGTTLNGLIHEHNMAPELFLERVHDIDLSFVQADPALGAVIDALPGRKIIHTNGSRGHAERVLQKLALQDHFESVFAIEDTAFTPKPDHRAYEQVMQAARIEPGSAAMVEDTEKNLRVPHALGMRTLLTYGRPPCREDSAHVHFETDDLKAFLRGLVA